MVADDSCQNIKGLNIPNLKLKLRKPSLNDNSSNNSDNLIEIESEGEQEIDSPVNMAIKSPPTLSIDPN